MEATGEKANQSEVLIGDKKIGSYLGAISVCLMKGNTRITILARGRKISKAVDIAEIARREFNLKYGNIETYTEDMGNKRKVSVIRIELLKEV